MKRKESRARGPAKVGVEAPLNFTLLNKAYSAGHTIESFRLSNCTGHMVQLNHEEALGTP